METGGTNEPDREQLEFVTRSYAGFQGIGTSLAGVLVALYGAVNLLWRPALSLGLLPLMPLLVMAMFLVPRLVTRFYYRPKFGYVKPVSPNPSWWMIWLSTGAFTLFLVLMFKVSDYLYLHRLQIPFEPFSLLLGIVFVSLALSALGKTHYWPYQSLIVGLMFLAIALLPVFHLQTKEQVSNGWSWVVFGTELVIVGFRSHRDLVRNLMPDNAQQDHA